MLQKPKLPEGTGGIVTSRGSQALRNLLPTIHHTDPAMAEFLADVFNVGRPWAGGSDPLPTLQKLADGDDPVRNQQKLKQKKDEVEADLQKLTAAKTELNEKLQAAREPGVLKSKSQNLVNGANLLQTISEDVLEMEESPVSISPVFSEAETFVPDRVSDFEPSPASSKTKSQEYFPSSARFRVTTSVSSGENLKRQSSKIGTSNLSQNNGSNVGNKNSQNSLANKVEASNPTNTFSTPIQINHSFNDMLSTTASSPLSQTPDAAGDDGGYFPKSFRFRFDQNDKKSN